MKIEELEEENNIMKEIIRVLNDTIYIQETRIEQMKCEIKELRSGLSKIQEKYIGKQALKSNIMWEYKPQKPKDDGSPTT